MIFLAFRYLLSKKRQTTLTLLGIFFGTLAFVTISGFMLGFRTYLIDQLVSNNAHVHILAREEFLSTHSLDEYFWKKKYSHIFWHSPPSGRKDSAMVENPELWYRRLKNNPEVVAFTPQLTSAVIFSNGKATTGATLIGSDPIEQTKVTTIGEYIVEGSFKDLSYGGNRLIIGSELQKKLGVELTQSILVALPNTTPTPFKIAGIYKTGNIRTDTMAYGSIEDVQRVNQTPNLVNEIAVKLRDYSRASIMANTWSQFGLEKVESWDQQNASIFSVFKIQDAIRYLAVGSVLIVAGFGIYNVLNMTVVQKRKDIAILGSLGFSPGDIVTLFFFQGIILGLVGTSLGLICGNLLCRYLQTVPFGGGPMGGTGLLQVSLNPMIYLNATFMALASATIASILPARAAGKLTPIEIIRSGVE